MGKLAVTYYQDIMRGVSDVDVHKSGKDAIDYFKANVKNYFTQPVIFKSEPKISKDKIYAVRIGFRSFNVRFLNDDEVALYKEHGDDVWIDHRTAYFVKPNAPEETPAT